MSLQPKVISKLPHKSNTTDNVFRCLALPLNLKGKTVLTEDDKLDATRKGELSSKGELAELVYGGFDQEMLWKHRAELVKKGGILEGYEVMNGAKLLGHFTGEATGLQVAFTYNEANKDLSVAFSGSSCFTHFWHDADFRHASYTRRSGSESATQRRNPPARSLDGDKSDAKQPPPSKVPNHGEKTRAETEVLLNLLTPTTNEELKKTASFSSSLPVNIQVHKGFLSVYNDIEQGLIDGLSGIFSGNLGIKTLSLVGHSLGAVQTFLFAMMLLENETEVKYRNSKGEEFKLPGSVKLKLFAFGCPRIGPQETRDYYLGLVSAFRKKRRDDDAFVDCSSRVHMDVVTCVPLTSKSYKHIAEHPVYEFGGSLYRISSKDYDCTMFDVKFPDKNNIPVSKFPEGGHCFYNDRDFFGMVRKLKPWLNKKRAEENEAQSARALLVKRHTTFVNGSGGVPAPVAPALQTVATCISESPLVPSLSQPSIFAQVRMPAQSKIISELGDKEATTRSEKFDNLLRFIAEDYKEEGKGSTVLKEQDKLSESLQRHISLKGELAELAFGTLNQKMVWKHWEDLVKNGGILAGYEALNGTERVADFKGPKTGIQVVFTYDKTHEDLTVAFSGTSDSKHIKYILDYDYKSFKHHKSSSTEALKALLPAKLPIDSATESDSQRIPAEVLKEAVSLSATSNVNVQVHGGFLTVYSDLEQRLIDELAGAFSRYPSIKTLSIVGHSLGAAIVYLFAMMLLEDKVKQCNSNGEEFELPAGVKLRLYCFGCPRIGPPSTREYFLALLKTYRENRGDKNAFKDYSVRIFMDWAPSLTTDDYTHIAENPIYEFNGSLYKIPPRDFGCTYFDVEYPDETNIPDPKFPRGGHCFYNDRDFLEMVDKLGKYLKKKKEEKKADSAKL